MPHVDVAGLSIGNDRPLTVIAGPCQLESADHALMIAGRMKEACDAAGAQYVARTPVNAYLRLKAAGQGNNYTGTWTDPQAGSVAVTASITLAVVAPEYCGYSGTTRMRVQPRAFNSSSCEAMDGLP